MTDRPNIVLLVAEDTGRHHGCYGDLLQLTPNIDRLAAEGCRFDAGISHSPVCSPSRAGLVTGQYPTKIRAHHHRSKLVSPPRLVTHELRDAGYFVCWPGKQDFNFDPRESFRDCDRPWEADLREGRVPRDRPLFLYANLGVTHESGMWPAEHPEWADRPEAVQTDAELDSLGVEVDPAAVPVPPYLPDTPEVRADIARYYHRLSVQDLMVKRVTDAIDAAGIRENTLVIYLADHGRGLPREKRWLYEAGIHVPLIVRWPEQIEAGSVRTDPVGWVDVPRTLLSVAGVEAPAEYDGQVFLGRQADALREYAFAARDRMDETQDTCRAAHDGRYLYIRNLQPDRPYAQRNKYMEYMPTMHALREGRAAGTLKGATGVFMTDSKPVDELYDTQADPHCVRNLAAEPSQAARVQRMRAAVEAWMRHTDDPGTRPEQDLIEAGVVEDVLGSMRARVALLPERYSMGMK